jgi:hypothetical protein
MKQSDPLTILWSSDFGHTFYSDPGLLWRDEIKIGTAWSIDRTHARKAAGIMADNLKLALTALLGDEHVHVWSKQAKSEWPSADTIAVLRDRIDKLVEGAALVEFRHPASEHLMRVAHSKRGYEFERTKPNAKTEPGVLRGFWWAGFGHTVAGDPVTLGKAWAMQPEQSAITAEVYTKRLALALQALLGRAEVPVHMSDPETAWPSVEVASKLRSLAGAAGRPAGSRPFAVEWADAFVGVLLQSLHGFD